MFHRASTVDTLVAGARAANSRRRVDVMMLFIKRLGGYGLLFVAILQLASCAPNSVRHMIAYFDANPHLGDPPFVPYGREGLTTAHKAALGRFPDLDACLFSWGERPLWDTLPREEILRSFAWREIQTDAEAEVCLFRVLSNIGSPEDGEKWLQAQGFRTSFFAPGEPAAFNLKYGVQASWSIRAFGPKFQTKFFLSSILPTLAYGMTVSAVWYPETRQLVNVRVTYSTL